MEDVNVFFVTAYYSLMSRRITMVMNAVLSVPAASDQGPQQLLLTSTSGGTGGLSYERRWREERADLTCGRQVDENDGAQGGRGNFIPCGFNNNINRLLNTSHRVSTSSSSSLASSINVNS